MSRIQSSTTTIFDDSSFNATCKLYESMCVQNIVPQRKYGRLYSLDSGFQNSPPNLSLFIQIVKQLTCNDPAHQPPVHIWLDVSHILLWSQCSFNHNYESNWTISYHSCKQNTDIIMHVYTLHRKLYSKLLYNIKISFRNTTTNWCADDHVTGSTSWGKGETGEEETSVSRGNTRP